MVLLSISFLLAFLYVLLMVAYRQGFELQEEFVLQPGRKTPVTFISVIIPARNEAANIGACIDAILKQSYPAHLYEIIVVDDHSEDDTAAIVKGYADKRVRYVNLSEHLQDNARINAYKKAALAAGIAQSKGALIVTTDADCVAPAEWLEHIAALYEQEQPTMIVAPVIYTTDNSIVQNFQLIDFMSMQGITVATHRLKLGNMSNGANLAFSKDAFIQVNGYSGIEQLASGDDYLLMMKINHYMPGRIAYLKTQKAIVATSPQPDWKSFLQQRIRWASKSGKYPDRRMTAILLLVYLFNLSFVVLAIAGFFNAIYFKGLLIMLVVKIVAELLFLAPVARFFNRQSVLKYHPLLQPVHIVYIILAGFLGLIGGYQWKGRNVR